MRILLRLGLVLGVFFPVSAVDVAQAETIAASLTGDEEVPSYQPSPVASFVVLSVAMSSP